MPQAELSALLPHLRDITLKSGEVLYNPGETLSHIYFPSTCVLSVILLTHDGSGVEIGTTGCEGLTGSVSIMLGTLVAPSQTICQVPGAAKCLPLDAFQEAIQNGSQLHGLTQNYARASVTLMGQSIACNRLHTLTERCARWLLLTHDRVRADDFCLTQEFLAMMLGVHRPAVSIAAGALQQAGFIRYRRGRLTVVDREGLESASCECYRVAMGQLNGDSPRS
ncbi:MAG TPA: Crp/Fnr family transcriptional regulator [Candidatus Rubrimentiphilum sp.]|nr:Crp/Fnr family transcriptional regulator [Candidatus Rubrimentiphilum sp.]